MAKKETLGNYAVPGITGTSTTKPTTSPVAAATTTTTKTTSSSKKTSTSSSKGSSSSGSKAASKADEPSYSSQFYSALSNGIPAADDSAQRLAALQAQGEYEKAKTLSDISNKYLSELIELDKGTRPHVRPVPLAH